MSTQDKLAQALREGRAELDRYAMLIGTRLTAAEDSEFRLAIKSAFGRVERALATHEVEAQAVPVAVVTRRHDLGGEIDWTGRVICPVGAKLYAAPQPEAVQEERIAELEADIERLTEELDEAINVPWESWASQILKMVRDLSGYDGYDDSDGVDLVEEVRECLEELQRKPAAQQAEREGLTRKQIDDIMTEHYPLDSLLRENVDAFEACVRDIERALAEKWGVKLRAHGIGKDGA